MGEYRVTDGILAQTLENSVVLFHPETERLVALNPCGTRIWELLSEETTASGIVARLAEEFAGPEALIRQEAMEFLSQLETEQIIQRVE